MPTIAWILFGVLLAAFLADIGFGYWLVLKKKQPVTVAGVIETPYLEAHDAVLNYWRELALSHDDTTTAHLATLKADSDAVLSEGYAKAKTVYLHAAGAVQAAEKGIWTKTEEKAADAKTWVEMVAKNVKDDFEEIEQKVAPSPTKVVSHYKHLKPKNKA